MEELIKFLECNNYLLVTKENDLEVVVEGGNLLVSENGEGNPLPIPNSNEVRRLYGLPENKKGNSSIETQSTIENGLIIEQATKFLYDSNLEGAEVVCDFEILSDQGPLEAHEEEKDKQSIHEDEAMIFQDQPIFDSGHIDLQELDIASNKDDTVLLQDQSNEASSTLLQSRCHRIRENPTVWLNHKTEKCNPASLALIELFDKPKYQKLMLDKNSTKRKVWEMIAAELTKSGFRIAENIKEAGLKCYQKWRNMERTYLDYLKSINTEHSKEEKKRKKPFFFDPLNAVLSKQPKYSKQQKPVLDETDRFTSSKPNFIIGEMDWSNEEHAKKSTDCAGPVEVQQLTDHDYLLSSNVAEVFVISEPEMSVSTEEVSAPSTDCSDDSRSLNTHYNCADNESKPSNVHHMCSSLSSTFTLLQEVKTLHEKALVSQQEHFTKIVSLLEEQVNNQRTLNSLINQYITNETQKNEAKRKSKESKRKLF